LLPYSARVTTSIKLGPVAVSPSELHPLKMANALLTLNEISGGRAYIGGGERQAGDAGVGLRGITESQPNGGFPGAPQRLDRDRVGAWLARF
jgi:alkanesulfonate monooxygenase SsuD/methylene tetrahydromethanopterin reductase-like flavin-dependent oxidoreductase (luciferase family)